uniref:Putative secreted protein n=1 Tax=Ixodes ricinus TaxID=34613 RepID=A0A6B0V482_IXORI
MQPRRVLTVTAATRGAACAALSAASSSAGGKLGALLGGQGRVGEAELSSSRSPRHTHQAVHHLLQGRPLHRLDDGRRHGNGRSQHQVHLQLLGGGGLHRRRRGARCQRLARRRALQGVWHVLAADQEPGDLQGGEVAPLSHATVDLRREGVPVQHAEHVGKPAHLEEVLAEHVGTGVLIGWHQLGTQHLQVVEKAKGRQVARGRLEESLEDDVRAFRFVPGSG